MRRCWVNFQCRGVLLIWIIVGQGPIALAVGAGGGCLDIFSLIYHFSFLSHSLWETARYRLKYCLKGPLSTKQTTNQPSKNLSNFLDCCPGLRAYMCCLLDNILICLPTLLGNVSELQVREGIEDNSKIIFLIS